ncbi:hypothetical protein ABFS83_11G108100 [Erythranthe nasuta]
MDKFQDFGYWSQVYITATEEFIEEAGFAMYCLMGNYVLYFDLSAMMNQLSPPAPPKPTSTFSPPKNDSSDYSEVIKKLEEVDSRRKQMYVEVRQIEKLIRHLAAIMDLTNYQSYQYYSDFDDGILGVYYGYTVWYAVIEKEQQMFVDKFRKARESFVKKTGRVSSFIKSTPVRDDDDDDCSLMVHQLQHLNLCAPDSGLDPKGGAASSSLVP